MCCPRKPSPGGAAPVEPHGILEIEFSAQVVGLAFQDGPFFRRELPKVTLVLPLHPDHRDGYPDDHQDPGHKKAEDDPRFILTHQYAPVFSP
jgi:hypothetical protein